MRRPLRWPMVKPYAPSWVPSLAPASSTMSPSALPRREARKPWVSPSAMKQMSWLSGFLATASPRRSASARISSLVVSVSPSGNMRVGELPLVQDAEDVRLVLGHVGGAVQLAGAVVVGTTRGVVAGADRVEAEREGLVEQRGELDLLVAAQAGVRGAAGLVLGDEVLDDVLAEALGEVPHVERDADDVGGAAGVAGVLDGAAAARARAERLRVRGERQVDAGHVVPGLGGAGGGDGGVHAARHGGEDAKRAGGAAAVLSHSPTRVRAPGTEAREYRVARSHGGESERKREGAREAGDAGPACRC